MTRRVVLYIDSLKTGGAERVTLLFARWLAQEGWRATVLTRHGPSRDFYPVPAGVHRAIEPSDPPWLRCLGLLGFPLRVLRLRAWLQRHQPDLVLGMTTLPAIKLLLAVRGMACPCIVSERNFPPLKRPGWPWRLLRRLTYPWAHLHLVQTESTGRWLAQHLNARPQLCLANPVAWPLPRFAPDPDPTDWLARQKVGADQQVLLAVGTKAHQKGFDRLVAMFALLRERHPQVHLVILGMDAVPYHGVDQQAQLRRMLPQASHSLHFPGRVGNVQDWYERADLFLLPSRYEGFPNVLLEAMASGCCCVSSDCPQGPAELIRDGVNGRLLPNDANPQTWADVVSALLVDSDVRRRLACRALEVRQRFSEGRLRQCFMSGVLQLVSDD
ncbi:glycosyltransferase [Synechococcus sp. PROS-U-1]|uniref:glycosyltransferase n=1 Tax=Synechococcus sp. PROS-U-1 TaxID=1400866 RepID=UPI001646B1CE|nr:glycosyltransferase [Synechococcus sp. PROS-U-1]